MSEFLMYCVLKMMVKIGVIFFYEIPPCLKLFFYFIAVNIFTNSLTKITFFSEGFYRNLCGLCPYDKRHFKPKFLLIFHFDRVNDG